MARRFVKLVFDDFLQGAEVTYYMPAIDEELLGSVSILTLQAVADGISGTGVDLTVQAQHSADGRTWRDIATSPEIEDESIGPALTSCSGYVNRPDPRMK